MISLMAQMVSQKGIQSVEEEMADQFLELIRHEVSENVAILVLAHQFNVGRSVIEVVLVNLGLLENGKVKAEFSSCQKFLIPKLDMRFAKYAEKY